VSIINSGVGKNGLIETEAYRALSSKSRLEILKLLYKKPMSVEEMAEKLSLQPITIRHHLQSLEETDFIEAFEERAGSVGRPKIFYKIVKEPPLVSFPKRRYMTLTNFLMSTLQSVLGTDRTQRILRKAGLDMGENTIQRLELEHTVKDWTSRTFEQLFVKGYLEDAGSEPEIVGVTDKRIIYRLYNCLFYELAVKMPEVMCDILHDGFHEGVAHAMGKNVKTERRTCMAKGDAYCEHVWKWPSE
jgi:predicted ArsR family transcriptional regulator